MTSSDDQSVACPDPETIASVVDGVAPKEIQELVLEHLGRCERCYHAFSLALDEGDAVEVPSRPEDRRSGLSRRVVAGLAVATLAVLVSSILFFSSGEGDPVSALVEAVGVERVVTARLVGGFEHGPPPPVTRGLDPGPGSEETIWRVSAAALEIDALVGSRPTPGAIRALGLARLLPGDEEGGAALVEEAVDLAPDEAELRSDLAAAYLTAARRLDAPELLVEALSEAEAALGLRADLPEALFNRALALSELHLVEEARAAWARVATADSSGEWGAEARERARRLDLSEPTSWPGVRSRLEDPSVSEAERASLVAGHRQEVRILVQDSLLPRWGELLSDGDEVGAAEVLELVAALARILAEQTGDPMLVETTVEIEDFRTRSPEDLALLARAHESYGQARREFEALETSAARPLFEEALGAFEEVESPYALWVRNWIVACDLRLGASSQEILARLSGLEAEARAGSYRLLVARVEWLEGLVHSFDLELADSLDAYSEALEIFQGTGERENAAFVQFLLAEVSFFLGDLRRGWRHTVEALDVAVDVHSGNKYPAIVFGTGVMAHLQGHQKAALAFLREAERAARRSGDLVLRIQARQWRGRTLAVLGRGAAAAGLLESAENDLPGIEDPAVRARLEAEQDLVAAAVSLRGGGDRGRAVTRLTEALRYYETSGPGFRVPDTLLQRARAHLAGGDERSARADLYRGVDRLREATGSPSETLYLSMFDGARDLVATLVALELEESPERAFEVAELARAGSQRPLFGPEAERFVGSQVPSISEIQDRLSESATMVFFSVLPDQLLAWNINPDGVSVATEEISADEVERLVRRVVRHLGSGLGADLRRQPGDQPTEVLFDLLFGSIRSDLPRTSTLVVVPDRVLQGVPFAALRDRESARHLVELASVVVAPSASFFVGAQDQGRPTDPVGATATALVVGAPELDPSVFGDLPRLPGAAEEARSVATLYTRSELLLGREATARSVVGSFGRHPIVHFAGHALPNPTYPSLSRLPLAPDPDGEGPSFLLSRDIAELSLKGVHLVVLSGCSTGARSLPDSGGPGSLATAFLAAGAESVVASLWPLNDAEAVRLLESLHRGVLAGLPPEEALRAAQIEALRSAGATPRSRFTWAGLQLIGS